MANPYKICSCGGDIDFDTLKCLKCNKDYISSSYELTATEITRLKKQVEDSKWGIIAEKHGLRPIGLKILIKEDEFKSRYDCSTCGGKGHTNEICPVCKGTKNEIMHDEQLQEDVMRPCRGCTIRGERTISYGYRFCPTCNGKQGTIILTDDSKKRPTTGVILSIGNKVTEWKIGQHVIYNNYTGTEFHLEQVVLRVMLEDDVLCEYRILNKNKTGQPQEIDLHADLKEAGV